MPTTSQPCVLAVEDNPDTQTLLRYLLGRKYEFVLVSRVEEALEAARHRSFALFILDINLGEQRTGIDLLRALRELNDDAYVPAIALTAYAMPGDRERFLGAGFDAYVSKPFTRGELFEAIDDALPSSQTDYT